MLILGAYQPRIQDDRDPQQGPLEIGIVDEITTVSGDGEGSGALIFAESFREIVNYNPASTSLHSMSVVVAHEVAHLFSCKHTDGGLMEIDPVTELAVSNKLSSKMIPKIRGLMHP